MLYYLGKGTEFKKEECKEYKTLKNALAAVAKDEALTVWDENGVIVSGLNDNVTEGALNTNPDSGVSAYDENGNPAVAVDAGTVAEMTGNESETVEEDDGWQQESVIIPQGTMKVTVVCDGALNLRRSPTWGNDNICGRAVRGQSYYVKEIRTVDGKKMVRTIDDLYLSGQSEHVQFEQL